MLPKFYEFALPILQALHENPAGLSRARIYDEVDARLGLSAEDKALTIASGSLKWKGRVGWACSWLKGAGMVKNPARSQWQISETGIARLQRAHEPITARELRLLNPKYGKSAQTAAPGPEAEDLHDDTTPYERIDQAVEEIKANLQQDLLERLQTMDPSVFERAVLELLRAMGYVGDLGRVEHTGAGGNDGGIDGVLYLDRLGLERVHVQAKRWSNNVNAPVVRDFAGAMDVQGATKGVVVTTSAFTAGARSYVEKSPKVIRLIDGNEMTAMMIEFRVGSAPERVVEIPRIDLDFFED